MPVRITLVMLMRVDQPCRALLLTMPRHTETPNPVFTGYPVCQTALHQPFQHPVHRYPIYRYGGPDPVKQFLVRQGTGRSHQGRQNMYPSRGYPRPQGAYRITSQILHTFLQ